MSFVRIPNSNNVDLINFKILISREPSIYYMNGIKGQLFKALTVIYLVITGITTFSFAQNSDSIIIKRIDSLIQISRNHTSKREFDKALEVNSIAEQMTLDHFGNESAVYGSTCFNHGRILYVKADYNESEKWYVLSKDIREKVFGKDNLDYAASLNNLAVLYVDCCKYEMAEPLHKESKRIREKLLGKEHESYGISLNNLAILYKEIGEFEKAEELFLQARSIWEKKLGKQHASYANNIHNLASLYMQMGSYDKAEEIFLEALAIRKKILGTEHPEYLKNLMKLADIYQITKRYDEAEQIYIEVKTIQQKVFGANHFEYSRCLGNLAALYGQKKNYERAEEMLLEAKAIMEKTIGKQHSDYASILSTLGSLYAHLRNYDKAEDMILEARRIRSEIFGSPSIEQSKNLAKLYWESDKIMKCVPFILEANREERVLLRNAVRHLSEGELNSYIDKFKETTDLLYSLTRTGAETQSTCYDNSLFYKGFLLNTSSSIKNLIYANSISIEDNNLVKSYQRRLAIEYSKPINQRNAHQVMEFEERINALEKKLAKDVAGFGEIIRQVNYKDVQAKLRPDQVSIEFVHYRLRKPELQDSIMYAALVLKGDNSEPLFINLFEERELTKLLNANSIKRMEFVTSVYLDPISRKAMDKSTKSLYELIWQPIKPFLKNVKTIFFSPSGLLHSINLNAISLNPNRMLSDEYNLILLNSSRQLVYPSEQFRLNDHSSAALFGGLNYEIDTSLNVLTASLQDDNNAVRSELSISKLDSTANLSSWKYLNSTNNEIKEIHEILVSSGIKNARLLSVNEGNEETIKDIGSGNVPSPEILHLATHGYFFQNPINPNNEFDNVNLTVPLFKISEKPMLRSGLILAGANYAWRNGKLYRNYREDGILTAYEISQLNLRNTELVVLSACETGLGFIDGNEGVFGLQRAFKIAGVKNIMMSLWQVPDKQTAELMELFYKNWISKKLSIREALKAAQNTMRKKGLEPYYWAGFVLME
jgi:CHAT domain-containing protein/lipopolysaccharide biosynthesis regulator YciM